MHPYMQGRNKIEEMKKILLLIKQNDIWIKNKLDTTKNNILWRS